MAAGKQQKPADIEEFDSNGWAEIHRAASLGYFKTTERLVVEKPSRLELKTLDKKQVTPLWLAFRGGHTDTIEKLMKLGADVNITDSKITRGVVDIALHKSHYKLIIKLLDNSILRDRTVETLIENLSSEQLTDPTAMKCLNETCNVLDIITLEGEHIELFMPKNIINKLGGLLDCEFTLNNAHIETTIVRILFNIFIKENIELSGDEKLLDLLIEKFEGSNENSHGIILDLLEIRTSDEISLPPLLLQRQRMRKMYEFFTMFRKHKTVPKKFLTIGINCLKANRDQTQRYFRENTEILSNIVFLMERKKCLEESIEFANHYVIHNQSNQSETITTRVFEVLQDILQSNSEKTIIRLSSTLISSACFKHTAVQEHLLQLHYTTHMTSLLRKYKEDRMHEAIIDAIWSVAGGDHKRSIIVIKRVTIPTISEMATSNSSPTLQYYGSQMLQTAALVSYEEIKNHETLLSHLLNALKIATSNGDIVISLLKAIDCLCLRKGMRPNARTQKTVMEKQAVQILAKTIEKAINEHVVAQTWRTVAITTMKKSKYWELFKKSMNFFTNDLLRKLDSKDVKKFNFNMETFAIFVLGDNDDVIKMLNKTKQIHFKTLDELIRNSSEEIKVSAAFHLIILKDFIHGADASHAALLGINTLRHHLLHAEKDEIKCRTAEYICTVAGYDPGVKEALITAGTIQNLCDVMTRNDDIATLIGVAAALITISSSLSGEIELLRICRYDEEILNLLKRYGNEENLTKRFQAKWTHYKRLSNYNTIKQMEHASSDDE